MMVWLVTRNHSQTGTIVLDNVAPCHLPSKLVHGSLWTAMFANEFSVTDGPVL